MAASMDCGNRRIAAAAAAGLCGLLAARNAFVATGSAAAPGLGSAVAAPRSPQAPAAAMEGPSRVAAAAAGQPARALAAAAAACGLAAIGECGRRRGAGQRRGAQRVRVQLEAYASERQTYEGAPISPPPDLPSLLLKNRIVYLGTPITNEVTELILAQLLYLNYESADKPITMYINSTGSTMKNNTRFIGEQKVGMETDAFAIADCMSYIKPPVNTIAIGQAYGTAAILLGLGAKGKRFALPNATIMLAEPMQPPAKGARQASDLQVLAREVMANRATMAELLAKATGKGEEEVIKDTQRCRYMTPDEAVTYGLLDKVLTPEKVKEQAKEAGQELPSFIAAM